VYLGGNITLSPLTFLDQVKTEDTVVLELSSWQLGDLRGRRLEKRALLKPRVAVITPILPDHLDRYGTMEAYVADKRVLYQGQDRADATVSANDPWGLSFARETSGRSLLYSDPPLPPDLPGGWIVKDGEAGGKTGPAVVRQGDGKLVEVVGSIPRLAGYHQKKNLLAAALALLDLGYPAQELKRALDEFPGIEHRLEFFHERGGVRFYNDTAATIPEAAAAAIDSFDRPPILVTGGTDKALDFGPLVSAAPRAKTIILLEGTGSAKLAPLLDQRGLRYEGPFNNLDTAVLAALRSASAGDSVVLSPGCASFGMFLNEFDRGKKWKEAVLRLA
jgi:UDP-N-acetylmuramoylalanine--D-glutamate ligase